jgi:hypothetical protein
MIHRLVVMALFLLFLGATCFAQTAFQGLTPGTSTRNDVARALGQPVRTISATLVEYNPPAGIAKVEVAYAAGSSAVERIEVHFLKPITRQALIKKLGLSPEADAQTKSSEGKLVELFGGSSFLTLVYAAADVSSGVSRIGYYSRELFGSELAKARGARQNPGTQSGPSRNASGLALPELPGYMRGASEGTASSADYQGLIPGRSTRTDVERLLGQPVNQVNQTGVEYKPNQQGQSKIYVEYGRSTQVIERIVIPLTQPRTRADVLARLHLPEHATARRVNTSGNIEEVFGPPFYMVLTYQGLSAGVIQTERYSPESFKSAFSEKFSGTVTLAGDNSMSVARNDLPSARDAACLAADPGGAISSRAFHYNWAEEQDSSILNSSLKRRIVLLFECPTVNDDRLVSAFANISVLIAHYVPNAACFNGNRGVIGTDAAAHREWARARSRAVVLNNLQLKVSAAMNCLDRNRLVDFFADVAVVLATSG